MFGNHSCYFTSWHTGSECPYLLFWSRLYELRFRISTLWRISPAIWARL